MSQGTQNALFADLLDKLQAYVEKCGYTPTVYYINETGDEMAYAQMLCTERKPYGIFFIGSHPHCFTPELAGLGIPCVLLTNNAASLGIPNLSSVSVDDRAAAKVMIEHMYKQGRRRIGIIGDRPDCSRPSQQRLDGCLEAMQQLGLPFDFDKQYGYARFSMEESYVAAEYLLAHCPDLDAVFAMSDLMALGAVRAFQDHGLRVPQDVSVMSIDGFNLAAIQEVPLTAVHVPRDELGSEAVHLLQQRLLRPEAPHGSLLLHGTLVVRDSVRRIRPGKGHTAVEPQGLYDD